MLLLHLTSALFFVSLSLAWTTYVVPHSGGNDDTPALTAAFAANPKLATNATILFQQGVTYNILTPIVFPYFENVVVSVQGNLSYAADIKATQAIVASSSYPGHWFQFMGGSNVTLEGSTNPHWGWVNSNGQQWWNAMQEISSHVNRPFGWGFQSIQNGEIRYMKLWQPIAWSFSIGGANNVHIHHNKIMAISENKALPYNTDAFDVQGTNVLLENNIIFNGDDCLALSSPSDNIHFRNSYCNGGHGLSVCSLGYNGVAADVQNVMIENVTVINSAYGARLKTGPADNGTARNITWKDITIKKVQYPIYVTQNYWDQDNGPKQSSTTSNAFIDSLTFQNFQGTIDENSGKNGGEVVVLDLHQGAAKSIVVKDINTKTLSGAPVMAVCNSAMISTDVGFKCWNGVFQPTAAGE